MIEFQDVRFAYKRFPERPTWALDGLSLTAIEGEILGIAGPNGAGKTTLLSVLLGYRRAASGQARVWGEDPARFVARYGVGYVPENVAINGVWKVGDVLLRLGTLDGLRGIELRKRSIELLEAFELAAHRSKFVRELSKGLLQRLCLAQALMIPRRLIVLDEPTNGLDPKWVDRLRSIVLDLRKVNTVIVLASHNLLELERVADRVAILNRGRVVRTVRIAESRAHDMLPYRVDTLAGGAAKVLTMVPGSRRLAPESVLLPPQTAVQLSATIGTLLGGGVLIHGVTAEGVSLEDEFRSVQA